MESLYTLDIFFHKRRTCFQGKKETKYLDVVGSEHGMPQHLDREGCLFVVSGIFTRKLADRLKCAKRQWMQQSPVIKLNTIAGTQNFAKSRSYHRKDTE